ncbi:hypothetical protein PBI_DAMIEN_80 [Mycobacterium phage Damien]|uniref:hypothetical protein n=1 Tax=Mycobacterium phage Oaker TaxID=1445727 RepID=UPI0003E3C7B8|nr:hypothetical protein CH12_gp80 [Mycobacterium phage Oaker]YP_009044069.1 hypothetical protein HL12_gp80 [Mycobacterium phage Damien]AVO26057.1 hypothetical protein SEA_THUMB_81 [Mycobacterium phage Thumb]AXH47204.1 hypothetical protein SEA_CBORCH11_81 [Mycobacterium phage Cborch11]QLF83964.1 hypothetical protein SEA_BECKERTON_79 [Mycobacterium phage Beckerton]AHG24471.1 hypothetical protein PBI_OAKER_80 [Mycobacterium phage Oaker]AHZ95441.1 hypothetical protein PBI_DAMIEN_80 [Mycobacterium
MADTKDSAAHKLPLLDLAENDDQHFKTYMSRSMKKAIQRFARREGMTDSEAGRYMFKLAFEHPSVYGGYEEINSLRAPLTESR